MERANLHPKLHSAEPEARFPWATFIVVMLVAFFFRFYRLADHPLGIFFDPAINGLDAVRLIQRGGGPVVFIPTNGGREALFIQLLIPFIRLFGTTPFSIRALSAVTSLLSLALLFGFLYDFRRPANIHPIQTPAHLHVWRALPILSSLILAVSYWHIAVSRLGLRPILLPLFSVPAFWFFLKGWTTNQKRWFLLSGLGLGLAGYSYSAARLLPVILALALLPELFLRPRQAVKARLANLFLVGLTALIIYLPLAWYMFTHPAQLTARAFSVMVWNFLDTPAAVVAEIGRNILRVAGFFCCAGSPNPIFGLPGYPGLSFLLAPFLLIGLLTALKNWRNLFLRLVALWWLVGITPSIVAIEAPHPLRMIMAVVPTAILVGSGLLVSAGWLQSRVRPPAFPSHWALGVAAILILVPVPAMARAYFITWTNLQATRGVYDYGAFAIRDAVLSQADDGPIYLPLNRFNDATLLYYLSGTFDRRAALSAPSAPQTRVISPERNKADTTWVRLHNGTATILPPLTVRGQQIIQSALTGQSIKPVSTVGGDVVAHLAPLPVDPARFLQQPTRPITAAFGPTRLIGAHYSRIIDSPVDPLPVTLFWEANDVMRNEYEILLQLVDDQRRVWGNSSARPTDWVYPTSFWRPGQDQIAAEHRLLPVRPDPPQPGRYWLAVSVFDPAANRRLPLTEGSSPSPDSLFLGPLKVPQPPSPSLSPLKGGAVTFGEVAALSGLELERTALPAGEALQFTLQWNVLNTPQRDYTVFTHLLDEENRLVAGYDIQPVNGSYPTTIWSPGERILDPHRLPVPAAVSPGQYRLAIGLYDQATGERLPLSLPRGPADATDRLILPQVITVEEASK